jgi:Tfp pilus assembly protein PilN
MINLLPPDFKENYHYARRNNRLVRWVVFMSLGFVGLAALSGLGTIYLNTTASDYNQQVSVMETSLSNQKQSETEKQVIEISNDLKLALQVLSKQVLYSQMLKQLATIIPSNAALSSLAINQDQNALDITANTIDYTAATQLQVNLADPTNQIFSKADIINITCPTAANGTQAKRLPCTVTVRALFNTKNPFLFTSNTTATGAKP